MDSTHEVEVIEIKGPNFFARCSCEWRGAEWPDREVAVIEGNAHREGAERDAS